MPLVRNSREMQHGRRAAVRGHPRLASAASKGGGTRHVWLIVCRGS
jgi:hypothetical protein